MVEVSSIVLDHGTSAFEIRRECGKGDFLSNFPAIQGLVSLEMLGGWGTALGNGSLMPNLTTKDFLLVIWFLIIQFTSWLSSGVSTSKQAVMIVKHCNVSIPGSGPLLVIHASSGRPDGGGDLGDSLPLGEILPPIILNGFEAVGNMSFLTLGLGLDFMFSHWGTMGVLQTKLIAKIQARIVNYVRD